METAQLQIELFNQVKMRLPANISLVDSVASVLDLSVDSAYRRIRGEKALDLHEAQLLCNHFNISLDAILGTLGSRIMFTSNHVSPAEYDFANYQAGVLKSLKYFHSFEEKRLLYECKDIPLFHHYHSKELAAFKYFFWHKFLFRQEAFRHQQFRMDEYPDELYEAGLQISHLYKTLPSAEFWNLESMSSTLRQIDFFYDTGGFERKEDAAMVYNSVKQLMLDIEKECAAGMKHPVSSDKMAEIGGAYDVYINEVLLGANTILAVLGSSRMVFLNHSVFNYAVTSDLEFGLHIENYLKNLANSSTQISRVSEMERKAFFRSVYKLIDERIERL